eukprot:1195933-Prorocentrum_minimum.AAC.1
MIRPPPLQAGFPPARGGPHGGASGPFLEPFLLSPLPRAPRQHLEPHLRRAGGRRGPRGGVGPGAGGGYGAAKEHAQGRRP